LLEHRCVLSWLIDLDGDGDLDVVAASVWYENFDGRGNFVPQTLPESAAHDFVVADLDGDRDADVLRLDGEWYENENGRGRFLPPRPLLEEMSTVDSVVADDLDADGDVDLVLIRSAHADLYKNVDGHGTYQWASSIELDPTVRSWVDDVDADGDLDLLVAQSGDKAARCDTLCDRLVLYRTDQDRRGDAELIRLLEPKETIQRIQLADVDNDQRRELLLLTSFGWTSFREVDGRYQVLAELNFAQLGVAPGTRVLDVGDVNRDGVVDLLLEQMSRGVPRWFDGLIGKIHEHDEPRRAGDVNADGLFASSDLVMVLQAGEYEDTISGNSFFDEGDWNDDWEFTSADLVFAMQSGPYTTAIHPRLMFSVEEMPRIRQALERNVYAAKFAAERRAVLRLLTKDYTDPLLHEHSKSLDASRIAFVVLMLDREDPDRERLAEKAREILWNINAGTWPGTDVSVERNGAWGDVELHPWYVGNVLMEYSLAYDWMVGAGELSEADQEEVRFRLLRLAQIEHDIHSTPVHLLDRTKYYLRNANKRFRSLSGVGFVTLLFPEQRGIIYDPQKRIAPDDVEPFDSRQVSDWIMRELFEQITIATPWNPTDQGMIEHYVSPDGYYEEGYTYQNDAFQITVPFLVAYHKQTGRDYLSGNGPFDGRIAKMFTNNLRVMLPDTSRPTVGDSWSGNIYWFHELIAPYTENPDAHYWYFEEVLKSPTKHFGIAAAGFRTSDTPLSPPNFRTEFQTEAGIAVFRDQWGPDATYLMLLAPNRPVRGHNQADQGSISLYAEGTHLIIDPGYGTAYGRTPDVRSAVPGGKWNWLSSALAHSGITVDSVYHVDNTPAQELRSAVHPRTTIHRYSTAPDPAYLKNTLAARDIDYAEAHLIYEEKDARLVRAIAFPRHEYFLVEDRIEAANVHQYGWQLHFGATDAGEFGGQSQRYQWTTANAAEQKVELGIVLLDNSREVQHYLNGPTNYTGIVYPDDVFDHTYMIATSTAGSTRFATILDPHQGSRGALAIETLQPGTAWKVTHSPTAYDLVLSQPTAAATVIGELETNATLLVASIDVMDGREVLRSVLAKGGTSLKIGYGMGESYPLDATSPLHREFSTPMD
jgi:hypothetical protein